jgi:hypothetical protein
MRAEDFLSGKFKDLKFRISYIDELVTTQKEVDQFAIEFGEWINRVSYRSSDNSWWLTQNSGDIKKTTEELLEIFKKEKEL